MKRAPSPLCLSAPPKRGLGVRGVQGRRQYRLPSCGSQVRHNVRFGPGVWERPPNARGGGLLAVGGTLFLDKVGEIPLEHQAKLLRVLQEGTFERIGDAKTRHTHESIPRFPLDDVSVYRRSPVSRGRSDVTGAVVNAQVGTAEPRVAWMATRRSIAEFRLGESARDVEGTEGLPRFALDVDPNRIEDLRR